MRVQSRTARSSSLTLIRAVALAWIIAGSVDITFACLLSVLTASATPISVLQGIASGLLGAGAFDGGRATAALGLACHYLITLIWVVVFFSVFPRIRTVLKSRIVITTLYAVFVSLVMDFIVLPLSKVAAQPFQLRFFVLKTVVLIFSIGTPLTIVADSYWGGRPRSGANNPPSARTP